MSSTSGLITKIYINDSVARVIACAEDPADYEFKVETAIEEMSTAFELADRATMRVVEFDGEDETKSFTPDFRLGDEFDTDIDDMQQDG